MTDLRRMFYNRYKKSSIFSTDNSSTKAPINNNLQKEIRPKNDNNFIPKYNNMTSKERYRNEMRGKQFSPSNHENYNKNNNISNKSNNNSPSNNFKRSQSIKGMRKQRDLEKNNNLKSIEIMCKQMYNGYDPKKYKMKRSKSLYDLRSSLNNISAKNISNRQERNLAYNGSNIFFDKSKDIQIQKSFNTLKNNKRNAGVKNDTIRKEKSMTDLKRELNKRKTKYSHSRFDTDIDRKSSKSEDKYYDYESDYAPSLTNSEIKKKSFRRVNILKKEMNDDLKNKNREQIKESVKYNILSGKDSKDKISTKVYNKYNNNQKNPKKNFSRKKYDYKTNKNINEFNPIIEYYEIEIPKNYDLTDVNTIRNFFTSKGLHAFKIEEFSNFVTNQSGKICLRIRKDNITNDKEYNKSIASIKKLISKKDMKLYKVEGNKAKASTMAKQRVKTPYKGEVMLMPIDTRNKYKNNKSTKGFDSKKNSNESNGISLKNKNKTPVKKKNVNFKTKK